MKKRRIKRSVIKKGIILIIGIIIISITLSNVIKTAKYHKTDEYKLKKIGYNMDEIEIIETLNEENKNYVLNNEYNEYIDDFKNQKYFLEKNLQAYLDYKKNNNKEIEEIVTIINTGANNEFYTNTKETDISKKELMIVNKYHNLKQEYKPNDVINISNRYAYSDNKTSEEILEYYKKMFQEAEKNGIKLIISSSFRTYEEQDETYNYYKKTKGKEYAEKFASHPGFSEHQSGYAFDILTPGANIDNFEETDAFTWLQENAYKFGFIMRYPKDKENITGYEYEPWHYRYVGIEAATKIKQEKITFEEYYAYYVEK